MADAPKGFKLKGIKVRTAKPGELPPPPEALSTDITSAVTQKFKPTVQQSEEEGHLQTSKNLQLYLTLGLRISA